MGGSTKQESHQVQSNTINPLQMGQYQDNYTHAQGVADSLKPYTGQLTAGFNPNQIASQGILSGIATDPRYGAVNKTAMDQVGGIFGQIPTGQITPKAVNASPITASTYDPSTITAPTPYNAAQLAGTDLSPYYNPFQKSVIDASISQNGFARDQQGVKDNAAATAAHAFGGSRQGVQRAETTGAYDRNNQQNIAALNQANYSQAREGALADIGARNTASQFNNNMAFNVGNANAGILNAGGQFNAGQRQGAGIFNSGQDFAGQQFNSGQDFNAQQASNDNLLRSLGLRMNAAGELQQMNQADLGRATQQGGILSAVGDAQQAQQQAELTNAYNAYTQGQQLSLAQQQLLNQALGIIPLEQTNTSDGTQTTKQNPGALGILSSVAGLGLAAATGGSSLGLTGGLGMLGGASGGINGMFSMGGMFGPKYTGNGNGEF